MSHTATAISKEESADWTKNSPMAGKAAAREQTCCQWQWQTTSSHQHNHELLTPRPKILDSVLDFIGLTPMIRLQNITRQHGVRCEIVAKCEFYNAGGSVKDRIGRRMVLDAERSGRIKHGDCLIEPTSGNTGIGLALAAAVRGYRCVITLPEKMSSEKVDVLKALGAEIFRTPTEAAFDSPESHIGVAKRLNREIPNSHILDQYSNPSNPLSHYDHTGQEIVDACEGKLDYIVMSAGTGGTITGVARKIKENFPNCRVIGVDPVGSILARPPTLNGAISSYKVEGIGYDFIPEVLDHTVVDEWIKSEDLPSFQMARDLIRHEGLLCGGSSGATMWAAIDYAKKNNLPPETRMVVLLADSVRNYMSKFLSDMWMKDNGFMPENLAATWWSEHTVAALQLPPPVTVLPTCSCAGVVEIMKEHNFDYIPCVENNGDIQGLVTMGNLHAMLINGRASPEDPVSKVLYRQFREVTMTTPLSVLSRLFNANHTVLVVSNQRFFSSPSVFTTKKLVLAVATQIDLLNYIMAPRSGAE
eukprot:gnl/Spiro4/11938_TR6299_c0_g1_i1.p1 gnl/Spiro4/11938_TR6299_c0_g1~~gnl/Spiro4/11938_TR6299_c0_g1_i1.p1  ORF type:complete len:545 (-),score=133.38 gnl/Spiro4/11938_TR6299_c0_g1_i1:44-1636(-)